MSKVKVKKLKSPKISAEDDTEFNENDTKEIQDFISQLGLDKIAPELEKKKGNKKLKKQKEGEVAADAGQTSDGVKKAVSVAKESVKKAKKIKEKVPALKNANELTKKKSAYTFGEKPNSNSAFKVQQGTKQEKNKKIVFDDDGAAKVVQPVIQNKQNKKIIFDESYMVNSEDGFSTQSAVKPDSLNASVSKSNDNSIPWYNLLVKPDVPWYQQTKKLSPNGPQVSAELAKKYEEEGKQYLDDDCSNFRRVREAASEKSEIRWMQTVMKSGAFADKIAAHTLLVQESTPHNLHSLRFLLSLLNVKGRRECLASLDALLRLLTEGKILNPSAKLVPFNKQPLAAVAEMPTRKRQEHLAVWYFENQLKEFYNQFLTALDGLLKDAVETTRRKAITALSILLAYSPEQEQGLLSRLVNKVGDPTRAVATSSVAQLERLLQQHGNMKLVVVSEVERLLYRSNINNKAQYYALCFLSQILLDADDLELATKLIIIYVSFFKACVKKGEVDSKLMAALLTGVKRAFPYTKSAGVGPLDTHVDTLFKLVHMVRFGLAIQVMCILDQVVGSGHSNSDRFYAVLFRKLMDPELGNSTKQSMFLNLLFQSLKRDESLPRLRAFIKRILQVCLFSPAQLTCGLLYLVSEIFKLRPEARLFPSASVPSFAGDDDEEEHYEDIIVDQETVQIDKTIDTDIPVDAEEKAAPSTWLHRDNSKVKQSSRVGYDALARNPLYARAEQSGGYWEMNMLSNHFHPSASLFVKTVMEGSSVDYSGDPLQDFTLLHFLDRFVFRNPKNVATSQINMSAQRRVLGKRSTYVPQGSRALSVDSKEFIRQSADAVPADEMFLYQYFKQRATSKGTSKNDDDDLESVGSEDFEQYLADSADVDFAAGVKGKSEKTKKKKKDDGEDDEEGSGESDLEAAEGDSDDDFGQDEDFDEAFKEFDDMINEASTSDKADVEDDGAGEDSDGSDLEDDSEDNESDGDEDDENGFREEDIDFSEEDEAKSGPIMKKSKKRDADDVDDLDWAFGAGVSGKKKRSRLLLPDSGTDFVAAEEFSALLEDNAASGLNIGGTSEALSNNDKASVKQLQWEMSRDRWMHDKNRPRKGGNFKSKTNTGKKKPIRGAKGGRAGKSGSKR